MRPCFGPDDLSGYLNAAHPKLFCTRIGQGPKIVITGDVTQSDLPPRLKYLGEFVERIGGVAGVGIVEFSEADIVRHRLIGTLLKALA